MSHLIVEVVVALKYLGKLVGPNILVKSFLREFLDQYFAKEEEIEVASF